MIPNELLVLLAERGRGGGEPREREGERGGGRREEG